MNGHSALEHCCKVHILPTLMQYYATWAMMAKTQLTILPIYLNVQNLIATCNKGCDMSLALSVGGIAIRDRKWQEEMT